MDKAHIIKENEKQEEFVVQELMKSLLDTVIGILLYSTYAYFKFV